MIEICAITEKIWEGMDDDNDKEEEKEKWFRVVEEGKKNYSSERKMRRDTMSWKTILRIAYRLLVKYIIINIKCLFAI